MQVVKIHSHVPLNSSFLLLFYNKRVESKVTLTKTPTLTVCVNIPLLMNLPHCPPPISEMVSCEHFSLVLMLRSSG